MYRVIATDRSVCLILSSQPVGINLKESNRWMKKVQTILWPKIKKR